MDAITIKLIAYRLRKREPKFWNRMEKQPNGCWIWKGALVKNKSRSANGYGIVVVKRMSLQAHKLAWYYLNGNYPECRMRNVCGDTLCCNPGHWRLFGAARLTQEEVAEIRTLYKEGDANLRMLAAQFDISLTAVWHLIQEGKAS